MFEKIYILFGFFSPGRTHRDLKIEVLASQTQAIRLVKVCLFKIKTIFVLLCKMAKLSQSKLAGIIFKFLAFVLIGIVVLELK